MIEDMIWPEMQGNGMNQAAHVEGMVRWGPEIGALCRKDEVVEGPTDEKKTESC